MLTRYLCSLLVGLALLFALASCGKKTNEDPVAWRSEILLQDVQDSGCLSLPKLFAGLKALDPGRTAITIPTAISFESPNGIREDFRKLIAYGQLVVQRQSLSSLQSLPAVQQEACRSVMLTGSDGAPKEFTVKSSAPDELMAEAEDGERIGYAWLSPRSIRSHHRYAAFDQPCGGSDKPVLVTVGKVVDWSGTIPEQVPAAGSPFSIDAGFLSLAASAVGDSSDGFYAGADADRRIDLEKVDAISSKPPTPDVLSCGGIAPHGDDTPGPTP